MKSFSFPQILHIAVSNYHFYIIKYPMTTFQDAHRAPPEWLVLTWEISLQQGKPVRQV